MGKIKIRKVEASAEEVFARIEKILIISEKVYGLRKGITIKDVCISLGINELDYHEIIFDNAKSFNRKFIMAKDSFYEPPLTKIYRVVTWENPGWEKIRLNISSIN
jgi:hypothetical protein